MEFARLGAPLVRQLDDVGRACVAEVEEACPGHRCYVCGDAAGGVVRACGCAKGRDAHLACLARVASRESEANGSYPRWDRCAVCGDAFAEPAVRLGVAREAWAAAERAPDDDWRRVAALAGLADALGDLGLDAESAAVRRVEVAAGYAALLGEDDRAALDAVVALAESLGDRDRVREERGVLRDAPRARSALGAAHATTVAVVRALAVSLLYGDDDDGAAERARDAAEAKALVEAALVAVRRAHGEGHALVDALNAHLHHANRALGPVKTPKGYDPPPETPVNTPVPWVPPR
ncbi:hypothetical protein JL722_11988 [Aureococcus anophagefferens]|nr:hypothetical protein JL722_11988 [Aureococcus anophagefferens]